VLGCDFFEPRGADLGFAHQPVARAHALGETGAGLGQLDALPFGGFADRALGEQRL
jgi:hypothetical protein